jgi:hypothetical protein
VVAPARITLALVTRYRMPTGRDAHRLAAIEQVMAHLGATECLLTLLAQADRDYAARLLDALHTELRAAMRALRRMQSAD